MDKSHPLSSLIIVHSLEMENDLFCPKEDNEELLGPEVPYYSVIGALMNLANYTRPNIAFLVNLLVRYSFASTQKLGIKSIMYYNNMGLCYFEGLKS